MKNKTFLHSLTHLTQAEKLSFMGCSWASIHHASKIFIAFLLVYCNHTVHAQNTIITEVNEYDLGSWAYYQHNDICSKIHPAIESGTITAYGSDNKPLNKQQALRMFETSYVAFLSTNPYDPTEGRDTTVWAPVRTNFHSFTISGQQIRLMRDKNGKIVYFDKSIFYRLMSEENLQYLEKYTENGVILFENIPRISQSSMSSVNAHLFEESRKPGTDLFKTDSLLSTYSADDKSTRGSTPIAIFISTDPNDPTIGKDSVYYEELNIKDTSAYQGVLFVLKMVNFHIELRAISCGFHPTFASIRMNAVVPLGFLKYDKASLIVANEKKLLEYCLAFGIKDKLESNRLYYSEYLEAFNIKLKG